MLTRAFARLRLPRESNGKLWRGRAEARLDRAREGGGSGVRGVGGRPIGDLRGFAGSREHWFACRSQLPPISLDARKRGQSPFFKFGKRGLSPFPPARAVAGHSELRHVGLLKMPIRPAAVAGTWYPGSAGALARDVDAYLDQAADWAEGPIRAVIAPHAGLMFSGHVGACAYKAAATQSYDVAVLVGPSHFVGFDGVALFPDGAFATPLGDVAIDDRGARAIAASQVVRTLPQAHQREHSLEMQLPFLRRRMPDVPIVPLLIGHQTRDTILALAEALASAFRGRQALLVASTDLSHYFDAATAQALDARVQACIAAFDPEGFLDVFEQYPAEERGRYVACGGGAAIAVMMAARELGAVHGHVLKYAHSGEVSGDYEGVVGYVAGALGTFGATPEVGLPGAQDDGRG